MVIPNPATQKRVQGSRFSIPQTANPPTSGPSIDLESISGVPWRGGQTSNPPVGTPDMGNTFREGLDSWRAAQTSNPTDRGAAFREMFGGWREKFNAWRAARETPGSRPGGWARGDQMRALLASRGDTWAPPPNFRPDLSGINPALGLPTGGNAMAAWDAGLTRMPRFALGTNQMYDARLSSGNVTQEEIVQRARETTPPAVRDIMQGKRPATFRPASNNFSLRRFLQLTPAERQALSTRLAAEFNTTYDEEVAGAMSRFGPATSRPRAWFNG